LDRLSFDKISRDRLSAVPAAAFQRSVAVEVMQSAWRRRRMVIGMALIPAVLGASLVMLRPARYPAEALIELQLGRSDPALPVDAGPAAVALEASSVVLGEARIIRSGMVARRVVERLDLMNDPGFSGEGLIGRLTAWFADLLDMSDPEARQNRKIGNAARALENGLSVQTDNRSYLISISFSAAQPEVAEKIANAVAQEYLAGRLETNVAAAGMTAAWLAGQIKTIEGRLQAADAAVAKYREQTGLIELDARNDSLQQRALSGFAAQLSAASLARINDEAQVSRIEHLLNTNSPLAASELQAQPLMQAAAQRETDAERALTDLQSHLGPKHPAVQQAQAAVTDAKAALAAEAQRAVELLRGKLATTRATEADLRTRVEDMQREVVGNSAKQAELHNLQTAADSLRDRLHSLTRSRDQALALRDLHVVPASLVVPAQASAKPAGPTPQMVGILALIFGAIGGVALAAILERWDHGFRTSQDVTDATDLRCLGLVPELPPDESLLAESYPFATSSARTVFDEAVRLVASGVGLLRSSHGGGGGRVVVVASAMPGEGRSTLCAGLARAVSLTGRRVLVIDGLPRRFDPSTASEEPTPAAHGPNVALQTVKSPSGMVDTIRRASVTALSLDVFSSPHVTRALEEARRHFDVILIEGPPTMLVADALVLGAIADNVIVAVRWADTKRRTVMTALRRMEEHGVVVDGIVLARVDIQKHEKLGLHDDGACHLTPNNYYKQARAPVKDRPPAPVVCRNEAPQDEAVEAAEARGTAGARSSGSSFDGTPEDRPRRAGIPGVITVADGHP
jgi:succinoglycan biosynthesis transport protein ExoP